MISIRNPHTHEAVLAVAKIKGTGAGAIESDEQLSPIDTQRLLDVAAALVLRAADNNQFVFKNHLAAIERAVRDDYPHLFKEGR